MARELCDAGTGAVMQRLELRRHREELPGIWVPREIQNIHFDYHAPTEKGRERRVLDALVQILDVRLNNDVDDSLFEPKPMPPGSLQQLDNGKFNQVVPGGFEHMDNLVEWFEHTKHFAEVSRHPMESLCDYIAIALGAGVIVFVRYGWR
jgi:hypothetical protein